MAAVDFLPIAQPAARPDEAAARKPASSPDETGGVSFADVLETEEKAGFKSEAPVDVTTAPAQPALAATSPANAAAVAIAAVLLAPTVLADGEAPAVDTATPSTPAAPAKAYAAPAINQQAAVGAEATPASGAPAIVTAAPIDAVTSDSVADIPMALASAPPSAKSGASAASSEAATTAAASTMKANLSKQAAADQAPADAANDPSGQRTPDGGVTTAKSAPPTSPAPEIVAATPTSHVTAEIVAAVAGGQTPPKPAAPSTPSENTPGQRRKTAGDAIAQTLDASSTATKSGVQSAQPAASAGSPASGQAKPSMQATVAADAATPDVKTDAPAATSSSASTSSGSTSFADALAAARGQSAEGARAQTTSPHLQSAPSAAVQVYTRFVERFDGRAQRFEVRLDPAELGRVDVRIEVGADKKVHAVLAAHDSAALTDLMRGQRALERALSDAGIDLADNGLRFELSQDSGRNLAGQQRGDGQLSDEFGHVWRGFSTVDVAVEADAASATRSYSRRASRLDLVA